MLLASSGAECFHIPARRTFALKDPRFQEVVEVRSSYEALYFESQTSSGFNLYRAFRPGLNLLLQRLAPGRLPVRLVAMAPPWRRCWSGGAQTGSVYRNGAGYVELS